MYHVILCRTNEKKDDLLTVVVIVTDYHTVTGKNAAIYVLTEILWCGA